MRELTEGEGKLCTAIAARITLLRKLLIDNVLGEPDPCSWITFLAETKSIEGSYRSSEASL